MPYYLRKAVLAATPLLEIDKADRDEIVSAWRSLTVVMDIEEVWDCLIQNYIELEMELLRSAMHTMVQDHLRYPELQDMRLAYARRLANLLQSCCAYVDHTPHLLNSLDPPSFTERFKKLTNEAYDGRFGYRFMEKLRDFAQHRGLPLHGATFHSAWVGEDYEDAQGNPVKSQMLHSVTANVDLKQIRADKKFGRKVLAEIDTTVEHLDIATLTRDYVEGLAGVQSGLRAMMKDVVDAWKATVRGAIRRYGDINEGNVLGLCVAEISSGTVIEQTAIFEDKLERIEQMMRRNGSLINLHRRFVTNEITPEKRRS